MKSINHKRIIGLITLAFLGTGVFAGIKLAGSRPVLAGPVVHQVDLETDHATPALLPVKVGESVQFNTKDGLTHNIGPGQGEGSGLHHQPGEHRHSKSGPMSGKFGAGEAWLAKFDSPGTYYFHDHLHPKIAITVVVYKSTPR